MKKARAACSEGIRLLVDEAMRQERSHALQYYQPYERTDTRQGYANDFKPKTLATRVGPIQFKESPKCAAIWSSIPTRSEKGIRSEQALKLALAEMYVQGVSTRKVSAIVEELCGTSVSSTQVSQCAAQLDAELETWHNRPLGCFPYVFIDARYEKVRQGGRLLDCAVLIALGIGLEGKRSILGVSVAPERSRSALAYAFLSSLQKRGLHGVLLLVSDDHAGLGAARTAVFPAVPWQRCQFHLQQNAQAYVPRLDQRASVAQAIRTVFDCPDRLSAQARLKEVVATYAPTAPKLAAWMEENLPQGLAIFTFPTAHQRRLRTSNPLERVNMELKRRTRVAGLFNEASLLRLVQRAPGRNQ